MNIQDTSNQTGYQVLLATLADAGADVIEVNLFDAPGMSRELFKRAQALHGTVVVVHVADAASLDVMALRWIYPGGLTPLVLCPSNALECAELAQVAAQAANLIQAPVFILLEESVANDSWEADEIDAADISFEDPAPIDSLEVGEDAAELLTLNAKLARPPRGFTTHVRQRQPADGARAEWLVIAYGATANPAAQAVESARAEGQRVDLLRLKLLWPVPEQQLLKETMGIKHIVVAERNLGQYAFELRRVLPEVPVIPAGLPRAPVPAEIILRRLQRSPRCC